jgi:uncharacterized protein (TIGR02001 family)
VRRASLPCLLCLLALPAAAAGEPAWRVSGQAGAVSDYRWRGVSLTDGSPALQGQVNAEGPDGAYLVAWASSISDWREEALGEGARGRGAAAKRRTGHDPALELSASVGRTFRARDALVDISIAGYAYPGGRGGYVEIPVSVTHRFGPASVSAGASWAPPQQGIGGVSDRYVWMQAAWAPPGWRLQPRASIGREVVGAAPAKLDWSAGVLAQWGRLGLSLDWVGADQGAGSTLVAAIQRRF